MNGPPISFKIIRTSMEIHVPSKIMCGTFMPYHVTIGPFAVQIQLHSVNSQLCKPKLNIRHQVVASNSVTEYGTVLRNDMVYSTRNFSIHHKTLEICSALNLISKLLGTKFSIFHNSCTVTTSAEICCHQMFWSWITTKCCQFSVKLQLKWQNNQHFTLIGKSWRHHIKTYIVWGFFLHFSYYWPFARAIH